MSTATLTRDLIVAQAHALKLPGLRLTEEMLLSIGR